ncbi:MAG TPA: enoyl-CoA hydratase/isomerase family protein [Pseudoduganella sp.]|jgi:methylglutaconyl-CoA hydratase
MNYDTITLDTAGTIATITLNRPEVRNAFNEQAIAELTAAFTALGQVDGIRAIVLASNGAAYCAGADLNWMKKMAGYSEDENRADAIQLANMLRTIYTCPKPVVAKVHGDCFGGGVGLVAACDIAIAAEDAHFCLSEVKLGLIPATISPYVIKAMGENAARRYFLTAERFNAREALRIGLVHDVATGSSLDGQVEAIAGALAANSPNAVQQAKALVREIASEAITDTLVADTAHRIAQIRASGEGREGVAAFLEKRKPSWLT